jgi:multisubunit Na+/H+ antiporter MnhC subunit
MPMQNIVILAAIVGAFALFGVVLAYVNHIAGHRPDDLQAAE